MPAGSDAVRASDPDDGLSAWGRTRASLHRMVDAICDTYPLAVDDVDAIGWPGGRGYDSPMTSRTEDHERLTSVEAAADQLLAGKGRAVGWVAEFGDVVIDLCRESYAPDGTKWTGENARGPLHVAAEEFANEIPVVNGPDSGQRDLLRRVERLASRGLVWWPRLPPGKAQRAARRAVEGRLEDCGECGLPAPAGRDEQGRALIRRIDGVAYHGTAPAGGIACYWLVWQRSRAVA